MTWVERRWEGDPGAMVGRKAHQSFTYRAFVLGLIAAIEPTVSFETRLTATSGRYPSDARTRLPKVRVDARDARSSR